MHLVKFDVQFGSGDLSNVVNRNRLNISVYLVFFGIDPINCAVTIWHSNGNFEATESGETLSPTVVQTSHDISTGNGTGVGERMNGA